MAAVALMAAAALTACTDEEIAGMEEQPITFGTYIGKPADSRGIVYSTANLPSMGVYAFYTDQSKWADWTGDKSTPNFMNNQLVNRIFDDNGVATGWEYNPVKYWPTMQNDKLTFFAYAPYYDYSGTPLNVEWKDENEVIVHWDVLKEAPLMYADNKDEITDLNRQSNNGKVHFNFKHACAKVIFKIALAKELDPTLHNITMEELGFFGSGLDKNGNGVATYFKGDFNIITGIWTPTEAPGNQLVIKGNSLNPAIVEGVTAEYQEVIVDHEVLYLMPQDFSNNNFHLYLGYYFTMKDPNINNGDQQGEVTMRMSPASDLSIKFEAGKSYCFNILIGLKDIEVSAEVTPWESGNDYVVPFP